MKEIPLTRGKVALVDDDDFDWLMMWNWYFDGRYAARGGKTNGKRHLIRMHREILQPPPGFVTDHINRITLDNRRSNLRIATGKQNAANVSKSSNCTSSFKGVGYYEGRWRAFIKEGGRRLHIGCFDNEIDAALAYDQYARQFFGQFASPNFPDIVSSTYHKPVPTSVYRGVSWRSDRSLWMVQIQHNGVRKRLGDFTDEIEAARAYDAAARELHGAKAKLNFPNPNAS